MTVPKHIATIALLGGDTVVGRALALLLEGLGYEVRVVQAPSTSSSLQELLEGTDLILMASSLGEERRQELLEDIKSIPSTQSIPVLTLSAAVGEMLGESTVVPWPSGIEVLQQKIEASLHAVVEDTELADSSGDLPSGAQEAT